MTRAAVIARFALVLTGTLASGPRAQEQRGCVRAQADVRKDIEALAGPETEGRAVGSVGGQKALEHIARRMMELKLEPVRESARGRARLDDYLQAFTIEDHRPRPVAKETRLAFVRDSGETVVEIGTDAAPFRQCAEGRVEAPVVFVGYGLVVPEQKRNDYAGLDVKGKVVMVLRGLPRSLVVDARQPDSRPSESRPASESRGQEHRSATTALLLSKFTAAERAGAAAILLCNRIEEGADATGSRDELRGASAPGPEVKIPAFWLRRRVGLDLFQALGESFAERQRAHEAGKPGATGPIGNVSARLELRFGAPLPERKTANVIGVIPGRDAALAAEYVVIGAHHDHLGRGEFGSLGGQAAIGEVHPGADDNASGVAALLAAAAQLVPSRGTSRTLVFVAFGAGEYGMQGSRTFLESGLLPKDKIAVMINLDMVGRVGQKGLKIESVGSGLGLADALGRAARRAGVEHTLREDSSFQPERSDHITFLRSHIPSVWLTSDVHEQYRRPSDVVGLVDVPGVFKVAELVGYAAADLGARPARPEYLKRR